MDADFVSAAECAARKGVTRQAIIAAIHRQALPAIKVGATYVIRAADCDAYQPASREERGRRSAGKPKRGRGKRAPSNAEEEI